MQKIDLTQAGLKALHGSSERLEMARLGSADELAQRLLHSFQDGQHSYAERVREFIRLATGSRRELRLQRRASVDPFERLSSLCRSHEKDLSAWKAAGGWRQMHVCWKRHPKEGVRADRVRLSLVSAIWDAVFGLLRRVGYPEPGTIKIFGRSGCLSDVDCEFQPNPALPASIAALAKLAFDVLGAHSLAGEPGYVLDTASFLPHAGKVLPSEGHVQGLSVLQLQACLLQGYVKLGASVYWQRFKELWTRLTPQLEALLRACSSSVELVEARIQELRQHAEDTGDPQAWSGLKARLCLDLSAKIEACERKAPSSQRHLQLQRLYLLRTRFFDEAYFSPAAYLVVCSRRFGQKWRRSRPSVPVTRGRSFSVDCGSPARRMSLPDLTRRRLALKLNAAVSLEASPIECCFSMLENFIWAYAACADVPGKEEGLLKAAKYLVRCLVAASWLLEQEDGRWQRLASLLEVVVDLDLVKHARILPLRVAKRQRIGPALEQALEQIEPLSRYGVYGEHADKGAEFIAKRVGSGLTKQELPWLKACLGLVEGHPAQPQDLAAYCQLCEDAALTALLQPGPSSYLDGQLFTELAAFVFGLLNAELSSEDMDLPQADSLSCLLT